MFKNVIPLYNDFVLGLSSNMEIFRLVRLWDQLRYRLIIFDLIDNYFRIFWCISMSIYRSSKILSMDICSNLSNYIVQLYCKMKVINLIKSIKIFRKSRFQLNSKQLEQMTHQLKALV